MPDINGGANQQPASWRNFIDAAGNSETRYPGDVTVDGEFSAPGVAKQPRYVSGRYYYPNSCGISTSSAVPANFIRAVPFVLYQDTPIQSIGAKVSTLSAGGNFQLAIYANDPATNAPVGAPIVSSGNLSCAAVAAVEFATPGLILPAGTYWSAINQDNSIAAYLSINTSSAGNLTQLIGATSLATFGTATDNRGAYSVGQAFGTWPTLAANPASLGNASQHAMVFFRVA